MRPSTGSGGASGGAGGVSWLPSGPLQHPGMCTYLCMHAFGAATNEGREKAYQTEEKKRTSAHSTQSWTLCAGCPLQCHGRGTEGKEDERAEGRAQGVRPACLYCTGRGGACSLVRQQAAGRTPQWPSRYLPTLAALYCSNQHQEHIPMLISPLSSIWNGISRAPATCPSRRPLAGEADRTTAPPSATPTWVRPRRGRQPRPPGHVADALVYAAQSAAQRPHHTQRGLPARRERAWHPHAAALCRGLRAATVYLLCHQ
jgi:hypothetical protein